MGANVPALVENENEEVSIDFSVDASPPRETQIGSRAMFPATEPPPFYASPESDGSEREERSSLSFADSFRGSFLKCSRLKLNKNGISIWEEKRLIFPQLIP